MKERELARILGELVWTTDGADGARGTLAPGLRSIPVETSSGLRVSTALLNKATRKGMS